MKKWKGDRRRFLTSTAKAAAAGLWGTPLLFGCGSKADFDVIIEGALLVDGTGRTGFPADVGIRGEKIAEIGNLAGRSARMHIGGKGYVLAPGFIDIHTHTDIDLLVDPRAESKVRQGVTTEFAGQDGDSLAPLNEKMASRLNDRLMEEYQLIVDWKDFRGLFSRFQRRGISVNWGTFVGQGTLREHVVGMSDRPATEEELRRMKELAEESLRQGVWGISSGLEYTPGSFASQEEITELCSVMAQQPGYARLYSTHMRNEDDTVEEALEEAIAIARAAGVALDVAHFKASGRRNWHKVPGLLEKLEKAHRSGLRAYADRYPYSAYNTGLASLFPLWAREGGNKAFFKRLRNPELNRKMRREVQEKVNLIGSWESVLISGLGSEKNRWMLGLRMSQIAQKLGKDAYDVAVQLILEEENRVMMCGFGMSEENTRRILKHPLVAVASDGSALAVDGPLSKGHPHPRSFGTFPRVLGKYVREEKLFSLEEAVRKMTSLPAEILQLPLRGKIAKGYYADLVLFDPDRVADRATWENPKQYPEGIVWVLVNGQVVLREGERTPARPGKVLVRKI